MRGAKDNPVMHGEHVSNGGGGDLGYRPELDGLRAIAVTTVVLYHLGSGIAPGGFVGVDIFFVLSGFLITRLIARELAAGTFSLITFYERRVRRIAPALIAVCLFATVIALVLLMPGQELKEYSYSLVAAVGSVSNIWFDWRVDYFGPANSTQPLLHTWSLGVEEQFYMFFPLILMAVFRWTRAHIGGVIWLLFFGSLLISTAMLGTYPAATFYLLHSRAWELLLGSILALGLVSVATAQWQRECAAAVGMAAIIASAVFYDASMPFPAYAALPPCLGAALIIWSGGNNAIARVLRSPVPVFIGLISYSLYLWHWPMIVFARLWFVEPFSPGQQILLACMAMVLAALSWRYVETPFRRRDARGFSRTFVFTAGIGSLGTLAVLGLMFVLSKGLPVRFPDDVVALAAASNDSSPLRGRCHFDEHTRNAFDRSCVLGAAVPPEIIVYGDSHGAELSVALGAIAKTHDESVRELTASGCAPGMDFSFPNRHGCAEYNARLLKKLAALPPRTIILAAYSAEWMDDAPDAYAQGLAATIHALRAAHHRVIMLGPIPPHPSGVPVPATLARHALIGDRPEAYRFDPGMSGFLQLDARISRIADAEGAEYVSLVPTLCDDEGCRADIRGKVLYFDDDHLSVAGMTLIAAKLLAPVLWTKSIAADASQ